MSIYMQVWAPEGASIAGFVDVCAARLKWVAWGDLAYDQKLVVVALEPGIGIDTIKRCGCFFRRWETLFSNDS